MDWHDLAAHGVFTIHLLWSTLSSPFAQRLYVLAIGITAIGLALVRVRSRKNFLEELTHDYFQVRIAGRRPTLDTSIQKRDTLIRTTREKRARGVWLAVAELFALGVAFPTILLTFGTLFYAWFDPSVAPLVDDRSAAPVLNPGGWEVGAYITDHLLRGGLFDLMEVFKLHASTITNNRHAYGYTIGLFLFHLYVEAFLLFGLLALVRMALVIRRGMRAPTASPTPL